MSHSWVTRLPNRHAPAELHWELCKHCLRSVDSAHLRVLRFLRVARALRSIRVMRLVHYIGALRTLVHLVLKARFVLPELYVFCNRRFVSAQVLNREYYGQPLMDHATDGFCAATVTTERKTQFVNSLLSLLNQKSHKCGAIFRPRHLAGHDLLLVPWQDLRRCCYWGCSKSSGRDADLYKDIYLHISIYLYTYTSLCVCAWVRVHVCTLLYIHVCIYMYGCRFSPCLRATAQVWCNPGTDCHRQLPYPATSRHGRHQCRTAVRRRSPHAAWLNSLVWTFNFVELSIAKHGESP